MKKAIKIILLVIGILVIVFGALYFLAMKGVVPINIVPSARTVYTGHVEIENISLSDIKTKLEERGCHVNGYKGGADGTVSFCLYVEKENGIEVYPRGMGWGPLSFSLTQNKLSTVKDIDGPPNPEKFKEEVRQDVTDIGNIVRIKENSWKITKTDYPVTYVY
jgi:hypothetical protein